MLEAKKRCGIAQNSTIEFLENEAQIKQKKPRNVRNDRQHSALSKIKMIR
jgi:hypothetical protein